MGFWQRQLSGFSELGEKAPTLRESWDFALYVNIGMGIFWLIQGEAYTFGQFLLAVAVGFPVMHLLNLGFHRWARARHFSERKGT
jgi:hypothetical protein